MIDIQTNDFPPFLEEEFDRMQIPGGMGFGISYSSPKCKECVACGLQGDVAICISYSGDDYAIIRRKPISSEAFESLYRLIPSAVKKSGFIGAEDILDGESYLVKCSSTAGTTRRVLCNLRDVEVEAFRQLANDLDKLMKSAYRAKAVPERITFPAVGSPLQGSPSSEIVE